MAVISEYEEEEQPVQQQAASGDVQEIQLKAGTDTPPTEEKEAPSKEHDSVLTSLLEVHNKQPLELLTTVIDYLFRETDLSKQEGVESRVSEIVGAAKKRKSEADAEGAASEKIAKKEETPIVDLNKAPAEEEDVEEVNIKSSPFVQEPEDDEPEVPDGIVAGVDDYDEKIDGKGLSTSLILASLGFCRSFFCLWVSILMTFTSI